MCMCMAYVAGNNGRADDSDSDEPNAKGRNQPRREGNRNLLHFGLTLTLID